MFKFKSYNIITVNINNLSGKIFHTALYKPLYNMKAVFSSSWWRWQKRFNKTTTSPRKQQLRSKLTDFTDTNIAFA